MTSFCVYFAFFFRPHFLPSLMVLVNLLQPCLVVVVPTIPHRHPPILMVFVCVAAAFCCYVVALAV